MAPKENPALDPDMAASFGSMEGNAPTDGVTMPAPNGDTGMLGGMMGKVVEVFKGFTSHDTVARLLASNKDASIIALQQKLGDMVLDTIIDKVLANVMPEVHAKFLREPNSIWRSVAKVALGNLVAAVIVQFESYDKRLYIIADSVVKGAHSHWVGTVRLLEGVQFLFDTSVWKLAGEILQKTQPAPLPQQ